MNDSVLSPTSAGPLPRVAVVGGGLAGIAAAAAAVEQGCRVELFEQATAPRRTAPAASTIRRPANSSTSANTWRWAAAPTSSTSAGGWTCPTISAAAATLHFFAPDGRRSDFRGVGWLPAPLHLLPALLRQKHLGLGDRLGILRAMRRLAASPPAGRRGEETIGQWLSDEGQSPQAVAQFWGPVILSALADTPDRASLAAARKVFVDGFLAARDAYTLCLPRLTLREWIDGRMGEWLADRGAAIHRGSRVKRIDGDGRRATAVVLADDSRREFDFLVLAVPWTGVRGLLAEPLLAALPFLSAAEEIPSGGDHGRASVVGSAARRAVPCRIVGQPEPMGLFRTVAKQRTIPRIIIARRSSAAATSRRTARGKTSCLKSSRTCSGLAAGPRGETAASSRGDAAGGRLRPAAGSRAAPSRAANARGKRLPGGRLDGDRLAGDDGRGRPQRALGGRGDVAIAGPPCRLVSPDLPRGPLARWLCGT